MRGVQRQNSVTTTSAFTEHSKTNVTRSEFLRSYHSFLRLNALFIKVFQKPA
ncbi:hypothetical protein [Sphingobacterium sp. T2]|uniref:hypothetical protein n=1 Tax=Sphingobacterium sp. T2 TaxID=1590596 RepID=UPI00397E672B